MRIEVEPQALIDAGKNVGSLGAQLGALSDAMSQVLSSGIASGTDPAGLNFGIQYGRQADAFAEYLAQLTNSFKSVGLMLEATGINYQHADQASTPGGAGPSGAVSNEQAETKAGDAPYASITGFVPPPPKWWLIQPFLNMIPLFGIALTWPTGNSGMMNVTAAQWTNVGRGLKVFEPALQAAAMAAGAQDIPEVGQIKKALQDLGEGATKLATVADGIGTAITDFARGVQETQDAIRSLLDRLSLDGLIDTITGFFTGEGEDTLRQIADEVGTVLENFSNQIQGVLGLLEELGTLLGEASDAFSKWARPILVETFGEDAGNALATVLDVYTDIQVGGAVAVIGLVSGTVALADPDTWKGLADTAVMIAKDPSMIDDVLKQAGSEFIALDEWQGENPGRGFGEAVGNIATLFIPGGALAKGGAVAKGLAATRNLLQKGELGPLGRLPGLGGNRTPDMPELADAPAAPDIPEFTPPSGVPGAIPGPTGAGPGSPSGAGNAPVRPQGADPGSGAGTGDAPTSASPDGSGSNPAGAGAGSPSSGGPAPTGGSPSPGGGDGASSNNSVPGGGSPSSSVGSGVSPSLGSSDDSPGSGGSSNPPISAYGDSTTSGGPSKSGGYDGVEPSPSGGSASGGNQAPTDSSTAAQGSASDAPTDRSADHPDESQTTAGDDGSTPNGHGDQGPETPPTGLTDAQRDEILAQEKGSRPDPSEYLSQEYIEAHLERFDQGGTRFMLNDSYEAYGIGQRDGTTFLFPTSEIDDLMAQTGGDNAALERALGLPEGYLNDNVIRVDVPDLREYDLRVPSGNEAGANDQWIPGGYLPQGTPEAVIDGSRVPPEDLTITDLSDPEGAG
ncbi:hypothetical protein ACWDUN_11700 [Mycobacterium sp. NPDC003323]